MKRRPYRHVTVSFVRSDGVSADEAERRLFEVFDLLLANDPVDADENPEAESRLDESTGNAVS